MQPVPAFLDRTSSVTPLFSSLTGLVLPRSQINPDDRDLLQNILYRANATNLQFLVYLDTDVNSQEIKFNLGYLLGLQFLPSPEYPCLHIHLLEIQTA